MVGTIVDEPPEAINPSHTEDAIIQRTSDTSGTTEDCTYFVCNADEALTVTKGRRWLTQSMYFPAILSMLLSLSVLACGVAAFFVSPYFRSRQSYHVEYEWNALSLFLSGACFITAYLEHSFVGFGFALILAFASLIMAICAIPVHITNAYFRQQDMDTFPLLPNSTFDLQMLSSTDGKTGTQAAVSCLVCCVLDNVNPHSTTLTLSYLSLLAFRHRRCTLWLNYSDLPFSYSRASKYMFKLNVSISILYIFIVAASLCVFQNCRRLLFIGKPSQRQIICSPSLSILSTVQLICGLLLGAWLIAIEVLLAGNNFDFQSLTGSETLVHCLMHIGTGYINILALGDRGPRMLIVATIMNGLSALLSLYFLHVPLSMLSFVLERRWSTQTEIPFYYEARIFLCALSGITHIVLLLLSFVIFLRLADRMTSYSAARWFDPFAKIQKFWTSISIVQMVVGIAYALLDLLAVGLFFMYKIDYTPLPAFIICGGLFAHCGFRKGCPLLLVLTVIMGYFGIPYCFRDVYLFIFHVSIFMKSTHVNVPASRLTGPNLTVHMLLFLLALTQIITSFFLTIRTMKTLAMYWRLVIAKKEKANSISAVLKYLAWLQLLMGSVQTVLGGQIFFNRSSVIQLYGDGSVIKGMLLCLAAVLLLASLKYETLFLCSFFAQSALLTILLIQLDSDATLMHNYFDFTPPSLTARRLMNLGYANFAVCLMMTLICAVITYKLVTLLDGFSMEKIEKNQLMVTLQELKTPSSQSVRSPLTINAYH
ncbi:hypothetical protein M514_01045 [Trichuris suis]|uniref:Uncharacterized protein n=1 Tax=Trichuris suis TaxID=68888 RepID=A0A085MM36_9BILA|nr:hypothetical protein M513_01045 [Trichuris suis]KFD70547.1 hypothetical protein M514_01045 [Trichuris suis]